MKSCRQTGVVMLILMTGLLISCSDSKQAGSLGIMESHLRPCPATPNCVSSDSREAGHQVAPFALKISAAEAWKVAHKLIAELPHTRIVTVQTDYLHAECRSALFGFVDDLELHLRPADRLIAIRSASRSGYSDFGVNRQRVEDLRTQLINQGVVK
jgi:uncharacterized protein (DUF1499 family)